MLKYGELAFLGPGDLLSAVDVDSLTCMYEWIYILKSSKLNNPLH